MIISRTPLRVSLLGGGTDFPKYFNSYNSKILTAAINKSVYVSINPNVLGNYSKLSYSKTEIVTSTEQIIHPIIKRVFEKYKIRNVDLHISSDVPAGSGLGSSSSFLVGLLTAIHSFVGIIRDEQQLLREALEIEFLKPQKVLGIQDFLPPIYGGVKKVEINNSGVTIADFSGSKNIKSLLKNRSCLIPFGRPRNASTILNNFNEKIDLNLSNLHHINDLAVKYFNSDPNRDPFLLENLIRESWLIKKKTLHETNLSQLDEFEKKLRKSGIESFKLCGAGKSGYYLCITNTEKEMKTVSVVFPEAMRFSVEENGSQIIYQSS